MAILPRYMMEINTAVNLKLKVFIWFTQIAKVSKFISSASLNFQLMMLSYLFVNSVKQNVVASLLIYFPWLIAQSARVLHSRWFKKKSTILSGSTEKNWTPKFLMPFLALTPFEHKIRGPSWVAFTSCRLKHRLWISILPGLHSLPSPEIQMIRDHHGPRGGSKHAVEDGRGHFGGCRPLKASVLQD